MKKIILIVIALLSGFYFQAQEKILWDYPLKPGMEEWATLKTKKQMVDVCQIPLDIYHLPYKTL